jgi:hypothetical protein
MKAKEFEIKKRDPNWRAMQDIRRSGAGGQHKDKKKAAKQGEVKHKKQMAEGNEPDEEYLDKVISDLHKDALGFRPDREFGREWMSSSFEEKLKIYNNLLKSLHSGMQEGSYTTEKQIKTRIRQIMYDRKLSGTESNAGELNRLKQQLKDIRSQQGVSEDSDFGEPREILEDVLQTLEREVEWPLTDVMDPREVKQLLAPIVKAVNDKMMSMDEGRRDYGYDDFGNSLRPGSDEGSTEPPNNFAIYINGKKWKVFQGKGQYADDQYEMQQFRQLQAMAARKSQETGKKWEVARTGEPATK